MTDATKRANELLEGIKNGGEEWADREQEVPVASVTYISFFFSFFVCYSPLLLLLLQAPLLVFRILIVLNIKTLFSQIVLAFREGKGSTFIYSPASHSHDTPTS